MNLFRFSLPHISLKICRRSLFHETVTGIKKYTDSSCQCHESKSKLLTTPIFYVNAAPHIGHMYTAVIADALNRWNKLKGLDSYLSTGTDEHGLKIQQASEKAGMSPKLFCDDVAGKFKCLFDASTIGYDDFIRTTDKRHVVAVTAFWSNLINKGYIYKGNYSGWYSTNDESFVTDDQVEEKIDSNGNKVKVSKESGHTVEWTKEDNYMFRLSAFSERLLDWIHNNDVIKPVIFKQIVVSWINNGLPDLSVSRQRQRLKWGIPVPNDESQTIYVWLDALVNYLTVAGYPNTFDRWPASCHVIGKDILKFHAIYWPAFLMAADYELPKSILVHSHWTVDNKKMSKSIGNVVDPLKRIEKYSADALRFYLLHSSNLDSDGNYSDPLFVESRTANLCNNFGNLLSRCTGAALNPQQKFPKFDLEAFEGVSDEKDVAMLDGLCLLPGKVENNFDNYEIHKALDVIMLQLDQANSFFQRHKPWELKDKTILLNTIIHVAMQNLRICAILLYPVCPTLSETLQSRLGIKNNEIKLTDVTHGLENAGNAKIYFEKWNCRDLGKDLGPLIKRLKYEPFS